MRKRERLRITVTSDFLNEEREFPRTGAATYLRQLRRIRQSLFYASFIRTKKGGWKRKKHGSLPEMKIEITQL